MYLIVVCYLIKQHDKLENGQWSTSHTSHNIVYDARAILNIFT